MIMIVNEVAPIFRKTFAPDVLTVAKPESIMGKLALDPMLGDAPTEIFVLEFSNILKGGKVLDPWRQALSNKHSDCRVILISRRKNPVDLSSLEGVDAILIAPTKPELLSAVNKVAASFAEKPDIVSSADKVPEIVEFKVEKVLEEKQPQIITPVVEAVEALPIAPVVEVATPAPIEQGEDNDYVKRCASLDTMGDITAFSRELKANDVVRQIMAESAEYHSLENAIRAYQDKIYAIMSDTSIPSLNDKLEKIRVITYDKTMFVNKSNSIVEESVVQIVNTLTEKVLNLLELRLKELEDTITRAMVEKHSSGFNSARIASILDERASLVLDLVTLDKEIRQTYLNANDFMMNALTHITDKTTDVTGNPLLDAQIKLKGNYVTQDTINCLSHILTVADKTSEEFKSAERQVHSLQTKIARVVELDDEAIMVQQRVIEYMKANKLEDTVIAKTMLKKALKVFIGLEGSGRTIIPTLIAEHKSRSQNTLLVDLTGTGKHAQYGYMVSPLSDLLDGTLLERDFSIIAGADVTSLDRAQRLLVMLNKAADFYRNILLVLSEKQVEYLSILGVDTLSINYIVTPENRNMVAMKEVMENINIENCAKRIIFNKCDVPLADLIECLGVIEDLDINIVKVMYINDLVLCALNRIKPIGLPAVKSGLVEVLRYA